MGKEKQLPVYEVIFNKDTDKGVTAIRLTDKPLFDEFVKTEPKL